MDREALALELAYFLHVPVPEAQQRLNEGFHHNHAEVAHDFNNGHPVTDDELLSWYRTTDSYCWELAAYHTEPGFNYVGMCQGILDYCKTNGMNRVLCVGDGIGDLSMVLSRGGLAPVYHDLASSKTADFARYRFVMAGLEIDEWLTEGWEPDFTSLQCQAAVALDFLEHVTDVAAWTQAIYDALEPGGELLAQNAFAIGSPSQGGSIPMHLDINDHWAADWPALCESIGFTQQPSGWWKK